MICRCNRFPLPRSRILPATKRWLPWCPFSSERFPSFGIPGSGNYSPNSPGKTISCQGKNGKPAFFRWDLRKGRRPLRKSGCRVYPVHLSASGTSRFCPPESHNVSGMSGRSPRRLYGDRINRPPFSCTVLSGLYKTLNLGKSLFSHRARRERRDNFFCSACSAISVVNLVWQAFMRSLSTVVRRVAAASMVVCKKRGHLCGDETVALPPGSIFLQMSPLPNQPGLDTGKGNRFSVISIKIQFDSGGQLGDDR